MSFFFFKQKTAYEMRISDWSSDVCSSDLFAAQIALGHHLLRPVDQRQQKQPVVARFGGQRADRPAQVARRRAFAELAREFLRFLGILRGALDRAQQFDRRIDADGRQAEPVEGGIARMKTEIAADSEERREGKECASTGR